MCTAPGSHASRRGFTVIELMIAVIIGILLLIGVVTLWQAGNRIFRKVDANLEAVQSASIIMAVITDDMRNLTVTKPMVEAPGANSFRIHFNGNNPEITEPQIKLSEKKEFKFPITDPGITKRTPLAKLKLKWLTYKLEQYRQFNNLWLYHFIREEGGSKPVVYQESFVREIQFDFKAAVADETDPTKVEAQPNTPGERMYYLRVLVVGGSTTVMEKGPSATIQADSDFYTVPLVNLFFLDGVTERMSRRGLGKYWQDMPNLVEGP